MLCLNLSEEYKCSSRCVGPQLFNCEAVGDEAVGGEAVG